MQSKKIHLLFFGVMVLLFAYFMVNLFSIRFKSGDIYPAYSTLRSDPLGSKALFEAMRALPGLNVQRSYAPAGKFTILNNTCLLFLGIRGEQTHFVSKKEYEQIEQMLNLGARLIVALTPDGSGHFVGKKGEEKEENSKSEKNKDPDHEKSTKADEKDKKGLNDGGKEKNEKADGCGIDLFEKLGIHVKYDNSGRSDAIAVHHSDNSSDYIDWPYAIWFEAQEDWQSIYTWNGNPVIIERHFEQGSIVMLASSYIFSNESLKKDENSKVLSWMVNDRTHIVFDEYHLGIREQQGISILMKKYHLFGPVTLLAFLFVLFIWKNATSIIPLDEENSADLESKKENEQPPPSGMVCLLRKHINKNELIPVCKKAWQDAFIKENRASKKYRRILDAVESATAGQSRKKTDPVHTYNRICKIMSEGEKHDD